MCIYIGSIWYYMRYIFIKKNKYRFAMIISI
nr:MAG TPA: hypothetical protein [Bacteriophage sp.]